MQAAQQLKIKPLIQAVTHKIAIVGWEHDYDRDALIAIAREKCTLLNAIDKPEVNDFNFPGIITRGDLQVSVNSGGKAPALTSHIRADLEAHLDTGLATLADNMAKLRHEPAIATHRNEAMRLILDEPLRAQASDRTVAYSEILAEVKTSLQETSSRGRLYIVGAGPGNRDYITLRAQKVLATADVVIYDRLIGDDILNLARRDAKFIFVGKQPKNHPIPQPDINELLVSSCKEGKQVVRLKGGDPMLFARGGEEVDTALAHGIAVEIVPGISAASGCAASAGIPLTHRDHSDSCLLLTAHNVDGISNLDLELLKRERTTVVLYMAMGRLAEITERAQQAGIDGSIQVAVVHWGTTTKQRVLVSTLDQVAQDCAQQELGAPALLYIGGVVDTERMTSLNVLG